MYITKQPPIDIQCCFRVVSYEVYNLLPMQPDLVAPSDKAAAEKSFKEVSEAYAKLTGSEPFPECILQKTNAITDDGRIFTMPATIRSSHNRHLMACIHVNMLQEPQLVIGRVVGIPIGAEVNLLHGQSTGGQLVKQHLDLSNSSKQYMLNNTLDILSLTMQMVQRLGIHHRWDWCSFCSTIFKRHCCPHHPHAADIYRSLSWPVSTSLPHTHMVTCSCS